ncbi:MAG: hypothetical protein KAX40_03850 [Herpetosiphon sp.]|nr:hypothetical protein [Herpetosiphon sp.]
MTELVLELPTQTQHDLDEVLREDGLTSHEVVQRALDDYLYIRKLRRLRAKMLDQADQDYTDDDIFKRVALN